MADIINQASVIRESLVGDPLRPPDKAGSSSAIREVIFGEKLQPPPMFELAVVVREAVIFDPTGTPPYLMQMVRETITGEPIKPVDLVEQGSVVREFVTAEPQLPDSRAGASIVVREVVMKEPPFKVPNVVREVLVNKVEPIALRHVITGMRQYSVTLRPPMRKPSTVKSNNDTFVLRELVAQRRVVADARSEVCAGRLVYQVAMRRQPALEENTRSKITLSRTLSMVTLSRGKAYIPVSEVLVSVLQAQYVRRREFVPAPQVRTPIVMPAMIEQVIQSRVSKPVIINTYAFAMVDVQQVVQKRDVVAKRSTIEAARMLHLSVQKRNVTPPGIDDRAASFKQMVTQVRNMPAAFGPEAVASVRNLVAQRRVLTPWPISNDMVKSISNLAVVHLDTIEPRYMLGRHASVLRMQSVQARVTSAPASVYSSVNVKSLQVASVHAITPPRVQHSTTQVSGLVLCFTFGKKFPLPWDVIDPAIGRHVANMNVLTVQRRFTESPGEISRQSRYVYNLASQVVSAETFPAPDYPVIEHETEVIAVHEQVVQFDREGWDPVTAITASRIAAQVVLSDDGEWVDATIPQSADEVFGLAQSVAVADVEFPGSMVAQSAAEVVGIHEAVASHDPGFIDPKIPQSEVRVALALEMAAIGDAQFPDPRIPRSDVRSSFVGATAAVSDPSMYGNFGMAEITAFSVVEFALISDPSLVGIPLRTGPRPIVTVSMS